jgi:cytochrome d ubiquinol oxidase subunit II
VWLILAIVLTFSCFPPVYARLGTTLHIPLTLMLVGIVLRGSAFTFRTYDSQHDAVQRRWGRIFASASVITPILLGVCIGAVASGRVGQEASGGFVQQFVDPWLTPFALSVGLLALTLFAFLAAVFLTLETRDRELSNDFRRRALACGVAVFLASGLVLLLAHDAAPLVRSGLVASPWSLPLHLATGLAALAVFAALGMAPGPVSLSAPSWLHRCEYRGPGAHAPADADRVVRGWSHPASLTVVSVPGLQERARRSGRFSGAPSFA